jgi:tRNA(Phe) wybutosine-synthesizing methylase Tyw3
METFAEPKEMVENPRYFEQRQKSLSGLTDDKIDAPIIEIINGMNKLPYCFTIQSCHGHFLYSGQKDRVVLDYTEALYIEKIRNEFFIQLKALLRNPPDCHTTA